MKKEEVIKLRKISCRTYLKYKHFFRPYSHLPLPWTAERNEACDDAKEKMEETLGAFVTAEKEFMQEQIPKGFKLEKLVVEVDNEKLEEFSLKNLEERDTTYSVAIPNTAKGVLSCRKRKYPESFDGELRAPKEMLAWDEKALLWVPWQEFGEFWMFSWKDSEETK